MTDPRPDPAARRDTRMRFEQWAKNPQCQANTLSAVHGIPMPDVAAAEGTRPTMGQSPFAIARGQMFERSLFSDNAAQMRQALEESRVLPEGSTGFADFRMRQNGGPMRDLDAALDGTHRLIGGVAQALGNQRELPTLVASATIRLPGTPMLPEAILVIDALTVSYGPDAGELRVGEIKTYPDRGGHTDGAELATARAQAGVYVHGLRITIEELGFSDAIRVSDRGFLVLTRPGFNRPSIRANEDLRYQAWRAERGFRQLEEAARGLPPPGADDPVAAIQNAATHYGQECISFCDRAPTCFAAALNAADPVILGEDFARFLGGTTLERALELLDGAAPEAPAEQDLVRRFNEFDWVG